MIGALVPPSPDKTPSREGLGAPNGHFGLGVEKGLEELPSSPGKEDIEVEVLQVRLFSLVPGEEKSLPDGFLKVCELSPVFELESEGVPAGIWDPFCVVSPLIR